MEWKDVLGELVTFLKVASPEAWRILLRQVHVVAFQNIVSTIVLLAFAFFTRKAALVSTRKYRDGDDIDWMIGKVFGWFGFGLSILIAVVCLSSAVSRFINPEFYAIQYLLSK